jgi:hypothetical protein
MLARLKEQPDTRLSFGLFLSGGLTPGISGERQHKVHKRNRVARVRCMPLLDFAVRLRVCSFHPDTQT